MDSPIFFIGVGTVCFLEKLYHYKLKFIGCSLLDFWGHEYMQYIAMYTQSEHVTMLLLSMHTRKQGNMSYSMADPRGRGGGGEGGY